jgi:isocitrate lyase
VLKLRDLFAENTMSNALALRLRESFTKHHTDRTACHTYGVPDVVSLQRMAQAGYGQ